MAFSGDIKDTGLKPKASLEGVVLCSHHMPSRNLLLIILVTN